TYALPYTHNGNGRQSLSGAVDKRLRIDPDMRQKRIQNSLGAVNLHPESRYNSQGHNHRYKKGHFEILFTVRRLVDCQRKKKSSSALKRHDDDHKFYRI